MERLSPKLRRRTLLAAGLALPLLNSTAVRAQGGRPLTLVVPFVPGGGSDVVARTLSVKLGEHLGQTVIVENRPGAGSVIGAQYVVRSPADGNTLLVGAVGGYVITPLLIRNTPYQPLVDFTPITMAARTPNVIAVSNAFPAKSLEELIAQLRKEPGKITFGSAGNGSSEHLGAALLWKEAGAQGIHVPYKGAGAVVSDLIAGHIDATVGNVGLLAPHVTTGKIRALAVSGDAPSPLLPGVPTVVAGGHANLVSYSWQGIAGPKGLPDATAKRLEAAFIKTLRDPEVKAHLEKAGFEVVASTKDEFGRALVNETARWKAVIEATGVSVE